MLLKVPNVHFPIIIHFQPLKRGQPLYKGQNGWSQLVLIRRFHCRYQLSGVYSEHFCCDTMPTCMRGRETINDLSN